MKHPTFNLIIVIELVLISLFGSIIYFKLHGYNNILGAKVSVAPISKDNVYIDKSSELKYYPEFEPKITVTDKQTWLPKSVTYTINSDTLNERYDYSIDKPPNTFRIITLGDSFTFGSFVDTPNNWPEKLEDKLNNELPCKDNKFEVINLGMGNYGVEYIKHRYELRGKKYNPDLIVWFESGTGFDRINEWFNPLEEKWEKELTQSERQKALDKGIYIATEKAMEEMKILYSEDQLLESSRTSWKKFLELRGGVDTLIVTNLDVVDERQKLLRNLLDGEQNISFFGDIPSLYNGRKAFKDGHPSVEGHEMIANGIFNYLKANYFSSVCK